MTQEHSPDLCARVAKVMGLQHKLRPRQCVVLERVDDGGIWTPWRPDTDPADAWRVLEYALLKHGEVTIEATCDGQGRDLFRALVGWEPASQATNHAAIAALCNAVAALGGKE